MDNSIGPLAQIKSLSLSLSSPLLSQYIYEKSSRLSEFSGERSQGLRSCSSGGKSTPKTLAKIEDDYSRSLLHLRKGTSFLSPWLRNYTALNSLASVSDFGKIVCVGYWKQMGHVPRFAPGRLQWRVSVLLASFRVFFRLELIVWWYGLWFRGIALFCLFRVEICSCLEQK